MLLFCGNSFLASFLAFFLAFCLSFLRFLRSSSFLRACLATMISCTASYSFNRNQANVVCRQLGMGSARNWGRSGVGTLPRDSSVPVWMDNVRCSGSEPGLESCPFGYGSTVQPAWGRLHPYCEQSSRRASYTAWVQCSTTPPTSGGTRPGRVAP